MASDFELEGAGPGAFPGHKIYLQGEAGVSAQTTAKTRQFQELLSQPFVQQPAGKPHSFVVGQAADGKRVVEAWKHHPK